MRARSALTHPTTPLLGLGLTKLLIHGFTAARYGFHRDEFSYIAGGQHLAWGFVDHPPLAPVLALLGATLFGATPEGLRVLPILAGAGTVTVASPASSATTALALGFSEDHLRRFFEKVEPVATTTNRFAIENEEYGTPVSLCRRPIEPLARHWPDRYHYD